MTFWGNASLRRALYTFCAPGDAARLRSSTCALLHRLHPKNEYPQASRACKYPSFCCRRKRSVRYGDSPFPASAVAKGIPDIIARFHNRDTEAERKRTEQSFFVPKQEIVDNRYDLSINKYKKTEYKPVEYPPTSEIMAEIRALEREIGKEMSILEEMLGL